MKISRNFTCIINWILDNLCPPILRDCRLLMYPIYWAAMGRYTTKLLEYKDKYPFFTDMEYGRYYEYAAKTRLAARPTDLNRASLKFILSHASGACLDAGSGRGYLAKRLAKEGHEVTGVDIVVPGNPPLSAESSYTFVKADLRSLPFQDASFDTVICSHVLEHVPDMPGVIEELMRVTKEKLVIVLPRQREYRYVADLHIHFFPYEYNIWMALPPAARNAAVYKVGGDWGILIRK